jgi:C4-dicarboxylate transporter DctQ subunit
VVGYSVALRYLFNRPQVWTDQLVGYLLVVVVLAGAAEALRRGEHIGVDLITERLSVAARRLAEIWGMAAVVLVSGCLVAAGWEVVSFSYDVGLVSDGYLEVPMWLPQAAVPAGAGLLGIAALNRLLRLLFGLNGPEG